MRPSLTIAVLASTLALGACKKPAEPAAAPAEPAPAPEVVETAPEPEPEPEPEPAPPSPNADFNATIAFADGSTRTGHVKRVERGVDWYAENGWSDDADDLTLELDGNGTLKNVTWEELKSVSIKYSDRSGLDCSYDSAFDPWMYMCVLRSTPAATTTDGKRWTITTRNKWRFTFDNDEAVEFYTYKLPARQQDDEAAGLDTTENYGLYETLQAQVLEAAKSTAVKSISIN